jgi:hypothetical protein
MLTFLYIISLEARKKYLDEYLKIEAEFNDIEIVPNSFQTSSNCVFGAFLSCSQHLFKRYNETEFSHIFLHTDADLLFRRGLYNYIIKNNIAFGVNKNKVQDHSNWFHSESMYKDKVFLDFLEKNAIPVKDKFNSGESFPQKEYSDYIDLNSITFSDSEVLDIISGFLVRFDRRISRLESQ